MQFCTEVLDSLGLAGFAIGQAERIWISAARKAALGSRDPDVVLMPPPAAPVDIPSVAAAAAAAAAAADTATSCVLSADFLGKTLPGRLRTALDAQKLRSQGLVKLALLSPEEAAALTNLIGRAPGALGKETFLRESSGSGRGGAYQAVDGASSKLAGARSLGASLGAVGDALSSVLQEKVGCGTLGDKVLLTRYGAGGANRAHQDQSEHPYQGYLLLSRPGRDFAGGGIYLVDPAAQVAAHKLGGGGGAAATEVEGEWSAAGELVVFAANATAGGAHWYHGVREVKGGSEPLCHMLAIGLLE